MSVANMIGVACVQTALTSAILGATAAHAAGPAAVNLGGAEALIILAKTGIIDLSASSIDGNIGISGYRRIVARPAHVIRLILGNQRHVRLDACRPRHAVEKKQGAEREADDNRRRQAH